MADEKPSISSIDDKTGTVQKTTHIQPKNKGINLLKRSKHDLLRLLSILEGELEARDIFIAALQAQLGNQRNAKHQYFVHRLSDPFLSLHRDDYVTGTPPNGNKNIPNELANIEPLPLLEKVVYQFKSQQQKMHQHMSLASKIHRKMAHELAEEKRKHAVDTKTGDDVTMALEKERERLKAGVMVEKERTKRIETEYRKLLGLCKEEGKKHKVIVMSLLAEQERLLHQLKQSKELQIDLDSTETELQARLHMALKEKQDLAVKLKHEQTKCTTLKNRMDALQDNVRRLNCNKFTQNTTQHKSALEQATELYSTEEDDKDENEITPELPVKMSRSPGGTTMNENTRKMFRDSLPSSPFAAMHHPMSIAQSSQDVTLVPTSSHPPILLADGVEGVTTSGYYIVKPGSSIEGLDAMKSAAQNKERLNLEFTKDFLPNDELNHSKLTESEGDEIPQNIKPQPPSVSVPPKPNRFVPGSPMYTPFRSPTTFFNDRVYITSSPTSGAANFAMNSPNAPAPPNGSPFSITRAPSVKSTQNFETPVKLSAWTSKLTSPGKTPIKYPVNSQFQATRLKFQSSQADNGSTVLKDFEVSKFKKENGAVEKKTTKKFTSVNYKSHISQKVSTSSNSLPVVSKPSCKTETQNTDETEKIKPLPPKTRPYSAPSTVPDQARPPPLPPKKPNLAGDKSSKRSVSMSSFSENRRQETGGLQQRKSQSVKKNTTTSSSSPLTSSNKPNSINQNDNNNAVVKRVKASVPPLPAKMSSHSQQPTPPVGPRQPGSVQQRVTSPDTDGPPQSQTTPKTPDVFFGTS